MDTAIAGCSIMRPPYSEIIASRQDSENKTLETVNNRESGVICGVFLARRHEKQGVRKVDRAIAVTYQHRLLRCGNHCTNRPLHLSMDSGKCYAEGLRLT